MATTDKEFIRRIGTVAARIKSREQVLLLLTGKRLEGLMKSRIFNKGKDSSNLKIGDYKSKSWIKKRSERGNQTGTIDLQFTGDLLRSFKTVQEGNEVVLAIVNDSDAAKAFGNEDRLKKKIFLPTFEEEKQAEEYFEDLLSEVIEEEFKRI